MAVVPVRFHVQDGAARPITGALLSAAEGEYGPWQGMSDAGGDFLACLGAGHYEITISHTAYVTRLLPADIGDPGTITIGLDRATGSSGGGIPHPGGGPIITRRGLVRANGKQFFDDDGAFWPLGITCMWAYQGWQQERERFKQNVQFFRDHGFTFIRMACQVEFAEWPIDPSTADYEATLGGTIDCVYDEFGMRCELFVVGGGLKIPPLDLAERVARVINDGRQHKVLTGEGANESFQNLDDSSVVAVTKYMRQHTPNLWAVSSPAPVEGGIDYMIEMSRQANANLFTFHSDRGDGDHDWRMVRQGYDCKEFPGPVNANEPPGPDSSVNEMWNPLQLACMRTLGIVCSGGAFVFHVGSMVTGKPSTHHPNRKSNIWEVDGIETMMAAVRDATTHLPEGVETWQIANTGWTPPNPVAPFQPDAIWPDSDHGVNKAYSALSSDGRFVQLPIGVLNYVLLTPGRDCEVSCYDMATNALVEHRVALAGHPWRLEGRADTMTAYLLVGSFV